MSNLELRNRDRIIEELKVLIKKAIIDPDILTDSIAIARRFMDEGDADLKIAQHISETTSIKIPAQHSDADRLFLALLREIVRDERALY